jgi:hypothetical protein
MAHDIHHALQILHDVALSYTNSTPRLWYPHVSWAWLGVAPRTFVLNEEQNSYPDDPGSEPSTTVSAQKARQGMAENRDIVTSSLVHARSNPSRNQSWKRPITSVWIPFIVYRMWNWQSTLNIRLSTSRCLRSMQHSRHLQHAMKNAAGVAILSFAAFLPSRSSGEQPNCPLVIDPQCENRQSLLCVSSWPVGDYQFCMGA